MAVIIDGYVRALHIIRRQTGSVRMYRSTTRSIQVTVEPNFVEAESADGRYFWSYAIEIANLGKEVVQLRSRHWRITDGNGKIEEVKGAGVVGKQPVLKPGEKFSYTSGCPLPTTSGIMVGSYQMQTDKGELFNIAIPAFSLDLPDVRRTVN
jgi:ApaG protein